MNHSMPGLPVYHQLSEFTQTHVHQVGNAIQPSHNIFSPITSWQIDGETVDTVADFIFLAPKSLQMVIAAMKLKDAYSLEGKLRLT